MKSHIIVSIRKKRSWVTSASLTFQQTRSRRVSPPFSLQLYVRKVFALPSLSRVYIKVHTDSFSFFFSFCRTSFDIWVLKGEVINTSVRVNLYFPFDRFCSLKEKFYGYSNKKKFNATKRDKIGNILYFTRLKNKISIWVTNSYKETTSTLLTIPPHVVQKKKQYLPRLN